jgi:uncharacterized coiled-coil DUF342 family protein
MSTVTDNDLKELKEFIGSKFEQVNEKFEQVNEKLNDMRVDIATLKEGQNGINKRLDNLDFIARSVIGGVILALILGLTKLLYPNLVN